MSPFTPSKEGPIGHRNDLEEVVLTPIFMPSIHNLRRREQRRSLPKPILDRNDAVIKNLGLAHHAAIRQEARFPGEHDDFVQEGCLGLIHGIANFDSTRGCRVSTYALTRIHGQIMHFRRDRQHALRIPWRLKDLHSRGERFQVQRLQQRLEPLDEQALADLLNVSLQRWREACFAHEISKMTSLDVAASSSFSQEERNLAVHDQGPQCFVFSEAGGAAVDPSLAWLKGALKVLKPREREWLLAIYVDCLSIQELAVRENLDSQELRRSIRASLNQLRQSRPASIIRSVQVPWPITSRLPQPRRSAGH